MTALTSSALEIPQARCTRVAVGIVIFSTVIFAALLLLFPWGSDGMFTAYDPLHYARNAEARPWRSVSAHHPLFHIALNALTTAFGALGMERPEGFGVKLLGALGCASMVVLVMIAGGRRRYMPALLLALFLATTRAFVLEGAAGENVPLGCAAAMLAVLVACRERSRLWAVGAALVLATLARQDNVLLAPAIALAVASNQPGGRRWRSAAAVLIGAGLVSAAAYAVIWAAWIAPSPGLCDWLFAFSIRDGAILQSWTPQDLGESRLLVHLWTLPVALIGEQRWGWGDGLITTYRFLGVMVGGTVILAAILLQGRTPRRLLASTCALVIVCRSAFFAWFEPLNFEWWLLPIGLLALAAAGWTRGAPRWSPPLRGSGVVLLLALAIGQLISHAPSTWSLREARLREAAQAAAAEYRRHPDSQLAAYESRAGLALEMASGVKPIVFRGAPQTCLDELRELTRESPVLLFFDREVWEGMPSTRNRPDALTWVDDLPEVPHMQAFRREGRVRFVLIRKGE